MGIRQNNDFRQKYIVSDFNLHSYLQIIRWQALLPPYKLDSCVGNSQVLDIHVLVTGSHGVNAAEVGAEILRHRKNVDFCRVFVLRAVNILGINIVLVHIAHHLSSLRLGQANA